MGKSFVALDYALCIATGRPYLGRFESLRGSVLYIAGEGVSGLRNRVKAWLAHHEVVTPPRNFVFIPATFNLLDEAEIDEVIQIARDDLGQNPSLVVIDTLARNFGGGNENATQDMNLFITNLDRLKAEFGCTVLVVHHTGKDAEVIRKDTDRDKILTAEEAKDYGIIDTVLEYRKLSAQTA